MRDIAMAAVLCAASSGLSQGAEPCGFSLVCGSSSPDSLFADSSYSIQRAAMYDRSFVHVPKTEPAYSPIGMIGNDSNPFHGTAFLFQPCYVLTNYHVLFQDNPADESIDFTFSIGYTDLEGADFQIGTPAYPVLFGKYADGGQTSEDFAVLRLEVCIGHYFGWADLLPLTLAKIQSLQDHHVAIMAAGYPRTESRRSLSVDPSCTVSSQMHALDPEALAHTCSSLGGMSGGPLYSELPKKHKLKVFGMLSSVIVVDGYIDDNTFLEGNDAEDPTLMNKAVPIRSIYDKIKGFISEPDRITTSDTPAGSEANELAPNVVDPTPLRVTRWDHNGSMVRLVATSGESKFIYELPRSGMVAAGVQSGSILFEGFRFGGRYYGTAYLFSESCGPIGYRVEGPVSDDERTVDLYGDAPKRDGQCEVVSYRKDHLVFSYVDMGY